MTHFESYFKDFTERYSNLLAKQDSSNLHLLLQEAIPTFNSTEKQLVASLHQLKARAYSLFAENKEMNRHFEAAVQLLDTSENWKLYLDWANLYLMQLRIFENDHEVKACFTNALSVVNRVNLTTLKKDVYATWAVRSIQHFCMLALAEKKELPVTYKTLDYSPLPLSVINNSQLGKEFYAHFFKNIALAIELRDAKFLEKLLKVISIDDATLLSNANLLNKFQQITNDIMDLRPEFAAEFNFLFSSSNRFKAFLPNFHLFISYLQTQNAGGLYYFFTAM
ncbi:MAG: hypothetical protein JW729_02645 [Bacteroidales bacterium]|nr:hypothetical protein [Bacteroidales bacterium]